MSSFDDNHMKSVINLRRNIEVSFKDKWVRIVHASRFGTADLQYCLEMLNEKEPWNRMAFDVKQLNAK